MVVTATSWRIRVTLAKIVCAAIVAWSSVVMSGELNPYGRRPKGPFE